jgi:hypothetical protein
MPIIRQPAADWASLTLTESQNSNTATTGLVFKRLDETITTPHWGTDPNAPVKAYETIAFDPYGQLVSKNGNNVVSYLAVAPGDIEPNQGVTFSEVNSLRGVKLSVYGIPLMLNEKNAFK